MSAKVRTIPLKSVLYQLKDLNVLEVVILSMTKRSMASSCQPTNEEIDKEDKEDFKLADVVVSLEDSKLTEQEEIKHQIF